MTQKDYVKIAAVFKKLFDKFPMERAFLLVILSSMENVLIEDNPKFDRTRFEKAIGLI